MARKQKDVAEQEEKQPAEIPKREVIKRIKVTIEQLKKLQDDKVLVGWDPANSIAIIKQEE